MKLLTISSSPADYVEMADLAQSMASRGHDVTLLYFHAASNPDAHASVLQDMREIERRLDRLTSWAVDIDSVPTDIVPASVIPKPRVPGIPGTGLPRHRRRSWLPSAEVFLTDARDWTQRRGLQISRRRRLIRTIIYPLARGLDRLRDPKQLVMDLTHNLAQLPRDVRRLREDLPGLVWVGTPIQMRRAIIMIRIYRCFLRFFEQAMDERSYDAVLVPEDVVGYIWPVAIKAAHAREVPVLVFPYTLANRLEPLQSLKSEPDFQTRNNRLAARLYPRWRLREAGADLVRLPSAHVFAHEALRISPPDPWMMNSGYADAVCVDSMASFEYFRDAGIPPKHMDVVGSVSQDVMFQIRHHSETQLEALRRELGLQGEKPLLLVSGCPNQLTAKVPYCEFEDFEAISAFVGESLAPLAADYHLVVRPHPNYVEFGEMLSRYGFVTAATPTSRLVPLASLFVAFASATIRWSIACAVPTVNYDVFHYGYGDFAAAKGVVSVSQKDAFQQTVRALRPGSDRYAALSARIHADSERWSRMDGECVSRIEAAIRRARAARAGRKLAAKQPA